MSNDAVDKIRVLGVDIAALTRTQFRSVVSELLRGDGPVAVAKVNAEFLLRSLADQDFRAYLGATRLNIADGIGVLWAARFLTLSVGTLPVVRQLRTVWQATYSLLSLVVNPSFCRSPLPERIPGVEALYTMLEAAEQTSAKVFILGASQDVNATARQRLQERYPQLAIVGGRDGYWNGQESVVEEIEETGSTLLVVALGCPKQEYWIRDNLPSLTKVRVAVGEGGSLDFIAGDFRRAPAYLQRIGLEWLWRLFMNPNKTGAASRARRIWNAVPVFVFEVVRWKLKNGVATVKGNLPA